MEPEVKACSLPLEHDEHTWTEVGRVKGMLFPLRVTRKCPGVQREARQTREIIQDYLGILWCGRDQAHTSHKWLQDPDVLGIASAYDCPGANAPQIRLKKINTSVDSTESLLEVASWIKEQTKLLVEERELRYQRMFPEMQCAQITKHEKHLWRQGPGGTVLDAYCPGLEEKQCHRQVPHDYHRSGTLVIVDGNPGVHISYACPGIKKNVPADKKQCPTKEPHGRHQYWLFPQTTGPSTHHGIREMKWGAPIATGGGWSYECDGVTEADFLTAKRAKLRKKLDKIQARIIELRRDNAETSSGDR